VNTFLKILDFLAYAFPVCANQPSDQPNLDIRNCRQALIDWDVAQNELMK